MALLRIVLTLETWGLVLVAPKRSQPLEVKSTSAVITLQKTNMEPEQGALSRPSVLCKGALFCRSIFVPWIVSLELMLAF